MSCPQHAATKDDLLSFFVDLYRLKPRGALYMCWTQCSMASQETPKAKRRKSLAGQGPLKEAVRSTLSVEEEEEWSGRELVLLQLPSSVCVRTCMSCTQYWHSHVGMKNTSVGVVGLWEE